MSFGKVSGLQRVRGYCQGLQPGAVMLLQEGQIIADWGETGKRIKLSSIRKSLLSALIGIYAEEGLINLDASLLDLGIDDSPNPLSALEKTTTIRMLLQARSGVYHEHTGGTPEMRERRPKRHQYAPGSHWHYNNWDFNALGTIFEQCTDSEIGGAFKNRLADPLGMQDFRSEDVYYIEGPNSSHRQYHFRMSTRDMARFGQLMMQQGEWDEKTLIPPNWVKESTKATSIAENGAGFGYSWWIDKKGVLFPGVNLPAGSFAAMGALGKYLVIIPENQLVVVHLQTAEWPDNADELLSAQLPGPDKIVDGTQFGELLRLILATVAR